MAKWPLEKEIRKRLARSIAFVCYARLRKELYATMLSVGVLSFESHPPWVTSIWAGGEGQFMNDMILIQSLYAVFPSPTTPRSNILKQRRCLPGIGSKCRLSCTPWINLAQAPDQTLGFAETLVLTSELLNISSMQAPRVRDTAQYESALVFYIVAVKRNIYGLGSRVSQRTLLSPNDQRLYIVSSFC